MRKCAVWIAAVSTARGQANYNYRNQQKHVPLRAVYACASGAAHAHPPRPPADGFWAGGRSCSAGNARESEATAEPWQSKMARPDWAGPAFCRVPGGRPN